MALGSFSLSLLMQVHEAAAVVESGGEAGDEWRPPSGSVGLLPCLPVKRATLTGVEARHGERLPNPAARRLLLVYSKSIYDLRTSTRAPHVSAAPVRCRKVVYPRGCTARPVSRSCTAVSSTDRAESLGL